MTNAGARPGNILILTKPLGTGIILAGQRLELTSEDDVNQVKAVMKLLNKSGAEVMRKFGVRAATDITGFGLAGHTLKMARASSVSITLNLKTLPLISNTYSITDQGCIPGAAFRNLEYVENDAHFDNDLDYNLKMIAFDAQTSGGLLMAVQPEKSDEVISELHKKGLKASTKIGFVTEKHEKYLYLED